MSDLLMDNTTGDLAIVNNSLVLVTDPMTEVMQRLRQRLRTFLGEWFLDSTIGIPFYDVIFVKGVNLDTVAAYFKREILGTPGVLQLRSYLQTLTPASRTLTISFSCLVDDGSTGSTIALQEVVG